MIWFGLSCLLVFIWGGINLAFLYLWSRAHDLLREREVRPVMARHRA